MAQTKRETYLQAQRRLLTELHAAGWTTKLNLVVPQAIDRNGNILRFRTQAVYLGAHSMWVDIRGMNITTFLATVENDLKNRT